jgi:hypothetical protein
MRAGRLLAIVALLLSSCGAVKFDFSYALPEQTVQGSPLGGLLPSFIPSPIPLNVDLRAETQKMNTGPASHVYLKSLAMQITITPHDTPMNNFDFLTSVHVFVAPKDSSSSLPQEEVAHIDAVPRGATKLDFQIVDGVDLLPYLNTGASLTATASGSVPPKDVTYDGLAVFTIVI